METTIQKMWKVWKTTKNFKKNVIHTKKGPQMQGGGGGSGSSVERGGGEPTHVESMMGVGQQSTYAPSVQQSMVAQSVVAPSIAGQSTKMGAYQSQGI